MKWTELLEEDFKEIGLLLANPPKELEDNPSVQLLQRDVARDISKWTAHLRLVRPQDTSEVDLLGLRS